MGQIRIEDYKSRTQFGISDEVSEDGTRTVRLTDLAKGNVVLMEIDQKMLEAVVLLPDNPLRKELETASAIVERVQKLYRRTVDGDNEFIHTRELAHAISGRTLPTEPGTVIIATFNCCGTLYADKALRLQKNGAWSTLDEQQYLAGDHAEQWILHWKPARVVAEED